MMLAGYIIGALVLWAQIWFGEAGKCPQTYSCSYSCSYSEKYTTKCGLFGWRRCKRYRTKYRTCYRTCSRNVCCAGYTGTNCLTPLCFGSTSCLNNHKCIAPDKCSCSQGYSSPRCQDIDECSSNKGGCQHACTNTLGSFICSCRTGYTLDTDLKSCIDNNECLINNGGCSQICKNVPGSFNCSCRTGFILAADGKTCVDDDECLSNVCSQNCTNTHGSYVCSCGQGYRIGTDKHTCNDIDECIESPNVCAQVCTNTNGSYSCSCTGGFLYNSTSNSCQDIDECLQSNGNCSHSCTNTPGSFQCGCQTGYTLGIDNRACKDVDECSFAVSPCEHKCHNTKGSYSCSCNPGYMLDVNNRTCTDIDDCVGVVCDNGGTCTDYVGTYKCACVNGYTGPLCQADVDECAGLYNGGCEDKCINDPGSYRCSCTGNSTLLADGFSCSGGAQQQTVFQRHNLIHELLPRGCHTIQLGRCPNDGDIKLTMSSSSKWYRLKADGSKVYTFGVVFVEVLDISLPISITGVELHSTNDSFKILTTSVTLNSSDGERFGSKRGDACLSLQFTAKDIRDFVSANSFLATFFRRLEFLLPGWLNFLKPGNSVLDIRNVQADIVEGSDISSGICSGAPVYPDRLYTVLEIGTNFSLDVYGQTITLPKPLDNKKFCIIVDLCQDAGRTMFFVLPEKSRDILNNFKVFKTLMVDQGLQIRPIGIGLSLTKHINVMHSSASHVEVWNGDRRFQYPIFPEANVWIGGGFVFNNSIIHIRGETNVYLSLPSIANLLKSVFYDEWNLYVNMAAASQLELKIPDVPVLGTQYIRGNGVAAMDLIGSVGGSRNRVWCGLQADPPGVYFTFIAGQNAFADIPLLKYIKPEVNAEVDVFVATDPGSNSTDLINETLTQTFISKLKQRLQNFTRTFTGIKDTFSSVLSNYTTSVTNRILNLTNEIENILNNLNLINVLQQPHTFISLLNNLWQTEWKQLKEETMLFVDTIRRLGLQIRPLVTDLLMDSLMDIQSLFQDLIIAIKDQLKDIFRSLKGFGLRVKGSLSVFNLKIIGLQFEIVYDVDSLGKCSKFTRAYRLFKGERAVRISFVLSTSLVKFIHPLLRLILDEAGVGNGLVISIPNPSKVALILHTEASFLGIVVQTDLFISNAGINLYIEGNIWDIFKTELHIFADHGNSWNTLEFGVKGRFVADADSDGDFSDSYLSALRTFTKQLADEAEKRISKAQNALTSAQGGLTKAQNWLKDKKAAVRSANSAFDNAIQGLEKAKMKLEDAKKPFQNALNKLKAAQRKVDRLCSIKTCKKICIPGIKCRICHKKVWGIKIPYPCCRFTSCMISFPNPICVAANLICRGIRLLAYAALEAAKIFIRVPMLALDAAKAALSVAQFVVDKSRIVLDIANAALSLAQLGLEGANVLLEGAKLALEVVKHVVRFGIAALNFIIKYGIQNIIDVRNCGFELTLSTKNIFIFDVHCEVNAFKLGFRKIGFRINFKDIISTIWNAAKATINALLKALIGIGRKRREIEYQSTLMLHKLLRKSRNVDSDTLTSEEFINKTINDVFEESGFGHKKFLDDYTYRVELFKAKCQLFSNIYKFFSTAIETLFDLSNDTSIVIENTTSIANEMAGFEVQDISANMTLETAGIEETYAGSEFNISKDELQNTLIEAKENITTDKYLHDVDTFAKKAKTVLHNQTEDANNMNLIIQWTNAMDNQTFNYFDYETCVTFLDCAYHSITELYEMFNVSSIHRRDIEEMITSFEALFLNLTGNDSHPVTDLKRMSNELLGMLTRINEVNYLCFKAPTMLAPLRNETVEKGGSVKIFCNVTGDPEPKIWWFKDGEMLSNETTMSLSINNVTDAVAGMYSCMAGNLVANLTIPAMALTVKESEVKSVGNSKSTDLYGSAESSVWTGSRASQPRRTPVLLGRPAYGDYYDSSHTWFEDGESELYEWYD